MPPSESNVSLSNTLFKVNKNTIIFHKNTIVFGKNFLSHISEIVAKSLPNFASIMKLIEAN